MAKNEIVQISNLIIWQKENKIYFKNQKTQNFITVSFILKDFNKCNNFNDFIDYIEDVLHINGFSIKGNLNEFIHLQRQISYCLHDILLNFNILNDYEYLLFDFDAKSQNEKLKDYIQKELFIGKN